MHKALTNSSHSLQRDFAILVMNLLSLMKTEIFSIFSKPFAYIPSYTLTQIFLQQISAYKMVPVHYP